MNKSVLTKIIISVLAVVASIILFISFGDNVSTYLDYKNKIDSSIIDQTILSPLRDAILYSFCYAITPLFVAVLSALSAYKENRESADKKELEQYYKLKEQVNAQKRRETQEWQEAWDRANSKKNNKTAPSAVPQEQIKSFEKHIENLKSQLNEENKADIEHQIACYQTQIDEIKRSLNRQE